MPKPQHSDAGRRPGTRDVAIRDDMIRLGQFLQLAGLVDGGAEAKYVVASGEVLVGGEPETRRGRQLHVGDVVEALGEAVRVTRQAAAAD